MGSQTSTNRQQAFGGNPNRIGIGTLTPKDFAEEYSRTSNYQVSTESRLNELCSYGDNLTGEEALICACSEGGVFINKYQDAPQEEIVPKNASCAQQDDCVPCVFTWTHGGHSVYVTGSFSGWNVERKIRLNRSGHEFSHIENLPRGRHYYKFIVDDQWRYAPEQQTQSDEHGNINNVLDISNFRHFEFKLVSDQEQAKSSVYHQIVPEPSEYTSDAPLIPLLLSRSTCMRLDPPPMKDFPTHCLATHIYHDAQAPHIFGAHVSCIATTQRWRIDNATPTSGQRYATYIYLTVNPLYPYTPPGDGARSGIHMPEPSTKIYYSNPLENLLAPPRGTQSAV